MLPMILIFFMVIYLLFLHSSNIPHYIHTHSNEIPKVLFLVFY
jgi:hypothetical protein